MSILIDVPQIAYKTFAVEYYICDSDGNRNYELEKNAEQSLRNALKEFSYSPCHDHVK